VHAKNLQSYYPFICLSVYLINEQNDLPSFSNSNKLTRRKTSPKHTIIIITSKATTFVLYTFDIVCLV